MGKISVVEDDADIREALAEILRDEGYEVRVAANGREALDELHAGWHPQLILLDLMMPVMNGWQFVAALHEEPTLTGIPVVVISADASVAEKIAGLRVAGLLKKPIQLTHLIDTVAQYAS